MTEYLFAAIKNYSTNYKGLPSACWQGITLTFINAISIGICFFLSLYFVDVLQMSVQSVGVMISCYGFGTVVGGFVSGKLVDKISPRIISALSLLIQSATFFLLVKLKFSPFIMINLFILGVAGYGFKTSNNVWVLNQCHTLSSLRLKVINISHAASNLGLGLSGVIIGMLASYGFQYIFYISGALLFFSALQIIFSGIDRENKDNPLGAEISNKNSIDTDSQTINNKVIVMILGCLFFIGLIIAQLSTTYPIYVQDAFPQLGIKAVSILFILDTVLIVLFQAPLVNFLGNYNKILIVGIGAFLMGLGMFVLSLSSLFFWGIISCVIWTVGEMLFMSMAQLVCYEKGAQKKKGQTMGIFQATFAMSNVVGPAAGGFVYQYFGGNFLWSLSAAIGIFCLMTCIYFKKYN